MDRSGERVKLRRSARLAERNKSIKKDEKFNITINITQRNPQNELSRTMGGKNNFKNISVKIKKTVSSITVALSRGKKRQRDEANVDTEGSSAPNTTADENFDTESSNDSRGISDANTGCCRLSISGKLSQI